MAKKKQRVKTKCDFCGIDIEVIPSKLKKNKNVFCGVDCSRKFKIKPKQNNYNCDLCGKESSAVKSHYAKRKNHF